MKKLLFAAACILALATVARADVTTNAPTQPTSYALSISNAPATLSTSQISWNFFNAVVTNITLWLWSGDLFIEVPGGTQGITVNGTTTNWTSVMHLRSAGTTNMVTLPVYGQKHLRAYTTNTANNTATISLN